jgi:hypothetical protein
MGDGQYLLNAVGNALAQEKRMRDAMEGLMHDHLGHCYEASKGKCRIYNDAKSVLEDH